MRIPGQELLPPLPEDPDMVLVRHDGLVMRAMRGPVPKELEFGEKYTTKLEGPLSSAFEVDRWLLSDLDAAAWKEIASDLQGRFTDEVIDGALRQMPPPWYAISGKGTLAALVTWRAGLVDYVLSVYRYYAKQVDVHATDQAEVVTLARGPSPPIEQFNFFGYGNDSTGEPTEKDYRAEQTVLFARPTARFELGRRLEAFLGPEVRYSRTPTTYDTIIGSTTPYGIGDFGQAAVRGGFYFDSRQSADAWSSRNITESVTSTQGLEQVSGVNLQASGFFVPKAWDVTASYGGADGVVAAYAGTKRAHVDIPPPPLTQEPAAAPAEPRRARPAGGYRPWADLLARSFAVDGRGADNLRSRISSRGGGATARPAPSRRRRW